MKKTGLVMVIILALLYAGCEKAVEPMEGSGAPFDQEMTALEQCAWPACSQQPPSPLVTVYSGDNSLSFWPFTGTNFSGEGQDPINLIFFGEADPRDIRAALLSLDGDRSAFGFPPVPPFNSTWDDAIGDVQTGYGEPDGWVGGCVQLSCGEYGEARFHVRLFRIGNWTVGNAHFEVLIPGTTDHQVLSWERAEEFVIADFIRSGLLNPDVPMIPTDQINPSPFRAIPAVIYNGLPVEIRQYIEGPLSDVSEDVPINTDGHAMILNLADKVDHQLGVWQNDLVINFDQVIPKPFCSSGPDDYVYVQGPVSLSQTVRLTRRGIFTMNFHADGELSVTPVDPLTGEQIGETLTARIKQHHASIVTNRSSSASSVVFQQLTPLSAPGAGWLFTRLRVNTPGCDGYQAIVRCASEPEENEGIIADTDAMQMEESAKRAAIVSIR